MRKFLVLIIFVSMISACTEEYTPKPRAYFRITFPQKSYTKYNPENCPYSFDYPAYARIEKDNDRTAEPCWINVYYPEFKARIHITYKNVNNNIDKIIEDSRTLVYKHTVKADAINEHFYENDSTNVYGILYEIKGNAASSLQFYITDSVKHFLRGSLYFYCYPNKDSLAPVIKFIEPDIKRIMETCEWK